MLSLVIDLPKLVNWSIKSSPVLLFLYTDEPAQIKCVRFDICFCHASGSGIMNPLRPQQLLIAGLNFQINIVSDYSFSLHVPCGFVKGGLTIYFCRLDVNR